MTGCMFSKQVLFRSIYCHLAEAGKTEMKGRQLVQVKSHVGHLSLMFHFAMLGGTYNLTSLLLISCIK